MILKWNWNLSWNCLRECQKSGVRGKTAQIFLTLPQAIPTFQIKHLFLHFQHGLQPSEELLIARGHQGFSTRLPPAIFPRGGSLGAGAPLSLPPPKFRWNATVSVVRSPKFANFHFSPSRTITWIRTPRSAVSTKNVFRKIDSAKLLRKNKHLEIR